MIVHQAFRFRVWPTPEQVILLLQHCALARYAYNWALSKRNDWWRRNDYIGKEPSKRQPEGLRPVIAKEHLDERRARWKARDEGGKMPREGKRAFWWTLDLEPTAEHLSLLWTETHDQRRDHETGEYWFHGRLERSTVTYALKAVDDAFKHFFRRAREGADEKGFPRFKEEGKCRDCFTVQDQEFVAEKWALKVGSKIGMLSTLPLDQALIDHARMQRGKVRIGEPTTKLKGKCLRLVVSRQADRWYVSVMVERDREDPKPVTGPVAGVDLGVRSVATVASGGVEERAPGNSLERKIRRLRRLCRRLDRRVKGSKGHAETAAEIAHLHAEITDHRGNHLHGISTELARAHAKIVVEGYDLRELVSRRDGRGRHVVETRAQRRKIADNAAGELRRQLGYKSAWYGSKAEQLPKDAPTNRTCSACLHVHEPCKRRDRAKIFTCEACSSTLPRQHNTAILLERIAKGEVEPPRPTTKEAGP